MNLPTKPVEITSVSPNSIVLYGLPKIGKTEALSKLENNLIIELDPKGADHTKCLRIQVNKVMEFRQVVAELLKQPGLYEFVSIDTVTRLEDWCETLATANYKASIQ